MAAPVGITIPKLLPITGTFVFPFTTFFLFQGGRAINQQSSDGLITTGSYSNGLIENVPLPFSLVLAAIAELNGADRNTLTGGLSALLVFRILSTEFGRKSTGFMAAVRKIGRFGTVGVLGGFAAYSTYLVKGYWGF